MSDSEKQVENRAENAAQPEGSPVESNDSAPEPSVAGKRLPNGRFPPGVCGNKRGHPKGKPNLVARYRALCDKMAKLKVPATIATSKRGDLLKQIAGATGDKFKNEEAIAAATVYAALLGEPWAIQQLVGRPDQNLDIKSDIAIKRDEVDVNNLTPDQIEKIMEAFIALDQGTAKQGD